MSFIETSALNSMNVEKAFQTIIAGEPKAICNKYGSYLTHL